ncbi:efflux transporter periplasmic adaptor subunit [Acidovorax sp. HMWF018]|uniref:efflux RND transporter periplasmic adaptor subunit n=1 Tax=Acidovorax sp. HMWF018 TaxID=2056855 RepID=UPI000D33D982|nr:efflux RND transporter periplasmic adaptor subunit [Acidovorax sp. HMWF018]PTT35904.1 efflux transporter periplasmic adaptor subunit [Acidovorax sp. HMWF018]
MTLLSRSLRACVHALPTLSVTATAVASALAITACGEAPRPPDMGLGGTPKVNTVTLEEQQLALTTELPGRVAPALIAEVRPQITGLVQQRRFKEGSDVKAGELLYVIDAATYKANVDNALAALTKAQANLAVAKLKAERYGELVKIKAVSQQDADDAQAALLQADAEVESARATVNNQRINLDYTRIASPISGRIGRSTVTPGALVTANQSNALTTVQQLDPIYVDVTQTSAALIGLRRSLGTGAMKNGSAKVRLILEDGSSYAHTGKLQFSDITVDQGTGAVTIRIEFPNPQGELLPGMYARAIIEEGVIEKALLVPQQAVGRDGTGKPYAYVVNANNEMEQRPIATDRAILNQWLVKDGLKAGDRVIVEGQQKAQTGKAVEAFATESPTPAKPLL